MFFGLKSRFLSAGPVGELAETTSLLRTRSRKVTEGSNPSLSAILLCIFFFHDFFIILFLLIALIMWHYHSEDLG